VTEFTPRGNALLGFFDTIDLDPVKPGFDTNRWEWEDIQKRNGAPWQDLVYEEFERCDVDPR